MGSVDEKVTLEIPWKLQDPYTSHGLKSFPLFIVCVHVCLSVCPPMSFSLRV